MTKDMWTIIGVGLVLAGLLLAQNSDISELRTEVGNLRTEVSDLRERMARVETIVERLQIVVERAHPLAVASAGAVDFEASQQPSS